MLQELEAQQADELASSDASFQQALQQLLQEWDVRISELQGRLQEAEQHMVARQVEEATALLVSEHTQPACASSGGPASCTVAQSKPSSAGSTFAN
jgi:predicted sugar kinase